MNDGLKAIAALVGAVLLTLALVWFTPQEQRDFEADATSFNPFPNTTAGTTINISLNPTGTTKFKFSCKFMNGTANASNTLNDSNKFVEPVNQSNSSGIFFVNNSGTDAVNLTWWTNQTLPVRICLNNQSYSNNCTYVNSTANTTVGNITVGSNTMIWAYINCSYFESLNASNKFFKLYVWGSP